MKRAALIITDAQYVSGVTLHRGERVLLEMGRLWLQTDPELLTDLRTLVKAGEWATTIADWDPRRRKENEIAAARVRALLPKEDS